MRAIPTNVPGVLIIEPVVHRDERGFFLETYQAEKLAALDVGVRFVQANHSRSVRHTLRGLHWQWRRPQAKLVRAVRGAIFDVAVDVRRGSPTFGRWSGVVLSEENFLQKFIPEGFAHGFCVLSEVADVEYLCSDYYDPGGEAGLCWNDPGVGIQWPVIDPVLSNRDRGHRELDHGRSDLVQYVAP